jgi:hypothetical protein
LDRLFPLESFFLPSKAAMPLRLSLLAVHVVLLVLASTRYTVVTGLGDGHFAWEYFQYHTQSGWGQPYQFPYSLPMVLTYLAAYATGIAAYGLAWRQGSPILGLMGLLLCGAGLASFAYELHHWVVNDYASIIVSPVIALLALATMAAIQESRHGRMANVPG